MESCDYINDFSWFLALIDHMHFSPAFALVVTDINGQLGGLQPFKAVALAAGPVVDVLVWVKEKHRRSL